MSTVHTLLTTCDKDKGNGIVTPVNAVEFPKGTCPCHGCYVKFNLKRIGKVKTATGNRFSDGELVSEYPDLVALVAATDDYRSLTVQGIQKKIISIASMLAPNCSGSGYDSFKGDTLKIVRA
ncbi:hypothetical protein [Citrobacter sp.]|uniref:hypothetical protein n=1 Tax=Citrobacter sp. TaxID=1896336 RepID=UPI002FC909BD